MQQAKEELVQFPLFSVRAVSVGRRIQDNAVVLVAALGLPFGKLKGIFHHPANPVQAAALHVLAGPGDYLTHGVQVGDIGPGTLGGERCRTRVSKQVQDFGSRQAVGFVDAGKARCLCIDKLPVGGLLREHTHVLEGREAQS